MKTKEELKELKEEYEALNNKLKELTEDELMLVTGGTESPFNIPENEEIYNPHIYTDEKDKNFFLD